MNQTDMKRCAKPLKPNPFEVYRDPLTGRWQVNKPTKTLTTA
ncbi:MAG: hypothetical protein ACO31I_15310 [Prochlorotrichaceae cyanobacterium]